MITVRLKGGMGNQMFQYALGRALALKHGVELALDTSYLIKLRSVPHTTPRYYDLSIWNIRVDHVFENPRSIFARNDSVLGKSARVIADLLGYPGFVRERKYQFNPHALRAGKNAFADGFWQSYRYWTGMEDILRQEFTLKEPWSGDVTVLADEISECSQSVCLNVRRGDFQSNAAMTRVHGVCDFGYYQRAMDKIRELVDGPRFYIFSDDIDWCREQFTGEDQRVVDHRFAGPNFGHYLMLMRTCRHFIIPNSTFGWWAAWISTPREDQVVIAPAQWAAAEHLDARDLVPQNWLRL